MKFTISATILLALIFSNPYGPSPAQSISQPTDRDLDGLVGLVKRTEEEVANMEIKDGKLMEGSRHGSQSVTYDRQGRMTHRWDSITGLAPTDQSFSYGKDNIRYMRYSNYNPMVNSTQSSSDESLSVSVFHFDDNENAIYEEVYVGDKPSPKALTQRYKYRFDTSSRVIEVIVYSSKGNAFIRDVYTYEADHNPTERRLFAAGKPAPEIIKYTYTLDSQGNWIKRVAENTLADKDRTLRIELTYRKISYY